MPRKTIASLEADIRSHRKYCEELEEKVFRLKQQVKTLMILEKHFATITTATERISDSLAHTVDVLKRKDL